MKIIFDQENFSVYEKFVYGLFKPTETPLVHSVLGIAGEAGELVDAVKKNAIYGKPLDIVNLEEEIGDLLFYVVALCLYSGLSLEDCVAANMRKLQTRYPKGYTDAAAIERADKQ